MAQKQQHAQAHSHTGSCRRQGRHCVRPGGAPQHHAMPCCHSKQTACFHGEAHDSQHLLANGTAPQRGSCIMQAATRQARHCTPGCQHAGHSTSTQGSSAPKHTQLSQHTAHAATHKTTCAAILSTTSTWTCTLLTHNCTTTLQDTNTKHQPAHPPTPPPHRSLQHTHHHTTSTVRPNHNNCTMHSQPHMPPPPKQSKTKR